MTMSHNYNNFIYIIIKFIFQNQTLIIIIINYSNIIIVDLASHCQYNHTGTNIILLPEKKMQIKYELLIFTIPRGILPHN